eukprot:jgi/Astpho2/6863/Aster-06535
MFISSKQTSCLCLLAGGSPVAVIQIVSNGHSLIIHTFRRSARKKCLWRPHQLVLNCQDRDVAQEWAAEINAVIRQSPRRPRTLLVLLNPFGGMRKARSVWRDIALPVFELAGVKCVTVETERLGHARQIIMHLTPAEVSSYDGIVAVGGDGLFQEALNGLLLLRARSPELGDLAARMRLGHIPAGSTDAVAYSLNGTRSELTAALHVALGDRMPLDVMRIDTKDGLYRFAVCVASYGYMGDLMQRSEDMRWLGPSRYNLAGALVLFQNRSYEAKGQWHTRTGSFKSIMAIVTPCRSDQSTLGLAPYSHLSDGRIQLVLVKECSILQYLQFLASIPQSGSPFDAGVVPGKFSYVDIVEATAVHVEPVGKESRWNVDGELLETNHVNAQVHRGLVEAFARAGIAEHVLLYPVDVIKTRAQALSHPGQQLHGRSVRRALAAVLQREGLRGLYGGVTAAAAGAGPAHAAYFATYEWAKVRLGTADQQDQSPHVFALAGMAATLASDAIATPLDVVKQRLQVTATPYAGLWDCCRSIMRREGLGTFFKSYQTTVVMNVPYTAVHFATYECAKQALPLAHREHLVVQLSAGALAGAAGAACTTPLDVVKTRLQLEGINSSTAYNTTNVQQYAGAPMKPPRDCCYDK